jgi:DNA-binding NtrC family response regulator
VQFTPAAMKLLMNYDWPGNVRELENCISRALILGDRERIDVSDLPPSLLAACGSGTPAKDAQIEGSSSATGLEELERLTIARVFEQVGGDKAMAGKMLGISRATLYRKLKRYQISGASSGGQEIATE